MWDEVFKFDGKMFSDMKEDFKKHKSTRQGKEENLSHTNKK